MSSTLYHAILNWQVGNKSSNDCYGCLKTEVEMMVYKKYWHMHVHNNIYLNRDVWGQGYNSFLLIFDDVEEMVFGIWIFLYGLEKKIKEDMNVHFQ